jgi:hypothetical protein
MLASAVLSGVAHGREYGTSMPCVCLRACELLLFVAFGVIRGPACC